MKKFFILFFLLFFGCSYKPSINYQQKILGNKIKPIVKIDIKNPRETIFLKDALNDAIYTFLDKNVCFQNCDSVIEISSQTPSLEVLDYDQNGYPVLYRSKVNLSVTVIDKNGKKRYYNVSGTYDFKIESQGVLNDEAKLNAYKNASINALNKLFALIAKDGANYDN